jgi:uncharacterized protein YlaN (UPF0358 family)
MEKNQYIILGDVANYLNEMAIIHRLISASTASAFCYMAREEISLEKLKTLIFLMLKIQEENEQICSTPFYEEIMRLESSEIETILELMTKAIEIPINLDSNRKIMIPTVKDFVQIGRSAKPEHGNDIVFKTDKTLSRVHLVVTAEKGEFFIEDRSANGTFVNGVKIEKGVKALVHLNDEIRIGREGTLVELNNPKISKLII